MLGDRREGTAGLNEELGIRNNGANPVGFVFIQTGFRAASSIKEIRQDFHINSSFLIPHS
jgi:hypothetical protein